MAHTEPRAAVCVDAVLAACAPVSDAEKSGLDALVSTAHAAMVDSQFQDAKAIARLSLFELRRESSVADAEGSDDNARALRDGQRSVAVDGDLPEARLALALATTRSLERNSTMRDPVTASVTLTVLDAILTGDAGHDSGSPAGISTLRGYIAFDRGDRVGAKSSFDLALSTDPSCAAAKIGLGHLARLNGSFAEAAALYETAGDAPLSVAATRGSPILPPPTVDTGLTITPGPLARPITSALCASPPPKGKPGARLCEAVAGFAKASTKPDFRNVAQAVLDGWTELRPLCESKKAECGTFVAPALLVGARAFQKAGAMSKAIALVRLVLDPRYTLPGLEGVRPDALLELGDRYFELGVYGVSAEYYREAIERVAKPDAALVERTLAFDIALGNGAAGQKLVDRVANLSELAPSDRARWIVAETALLRVTSSDNVARDWSSGYRAILDQGGMSPRIDELFSEGHAKRVCAPTVFCAARRIVADTLATK